LAGPSDQSREIRQDGANRIEGEGDISARLYAGGQDFSQTLKTALAEQGNRDKTSLSRIDGQNGPQIVDDYPGEVQTVQKDGRVVRERSPNGPDVVVAYDSNGKPHRFQDQPIKSLPVDFSGIPDWRLAQISRSAQELIKKYTPERGSNNEPDCKLSFNDISGIMKDIGKREDLTEVEKCRLWSDVRVKMQKDGVPLLDADEKTKMIDSWRGAGDPWHALITMNDQYHGNRLINMSPQEASKALIAHEDGAETKDMPAWKSAAWQLLRAARGRNEGDVNASEGQLAALRELRSQGTFAAYAEEWTRQFVRTDRDQYGRPR